MTKMRKHYVTHARAGRAADGRLYAFEVEDVTPRSDEEDALDHCDVRVTPQQHAIIRKTVQPFTSEPSDDGWLRGEDFAWIDTGDLSPGGLNIDPNTEDPNADFVLAR